MKRRPLRCPLESAGLALDELVTVVHACQHVTTLLLPLGAGELRARLRREACTACAAVTLNALLPELVWRCRPLVGGCGEDRAYAELARWLQVTSLQRAVARLGWRRIVRELGCGEGGEVYVLVLRRLLSREGPEAWVFGSSSLHAQALMEASRMLGLKTPPVGLLTPAPRMDEQEGIW